MSTSSPLADFTFPWDVPETPPLSIDYRPAGEGHGQGDRSGIKDPADAANVYLALIRDSREVCSHCFARVRSVSHYKAEARSHWRRSKREHLKDREDSRPVAEGGRAHDCYRTAYRTADRSGELVPAEGHYERRVACERCGWLGSRTQSRDLSFDAMIDRVPRLCARLVWGAARYRCPDAPAGYRVTIDHRAIETEIGRLRLDVRDSPGDTEIFASAVRCGLSLSPRPLAPTAADVEHTD